MVYFPGIEAYPKLDPRSIFWPQLMVYLIDIHRFNEGPAVLVFNHLV